MVELLKQIFRRKLRLYETWVNAAIFVLLILNLVQSARERYSWNWLILGLLFILMRFFAHKLDRSRYPHMVSGYDEWLGDRLTNRIVIGSVLTLLIGMVTIAIFQTLVPLIVMFGVMAFFSGLSTFWYLRKVLEARLGIFDPLYEKSDDRTTEL